MNTQEILSHVDHTLLSPTCTWEQIKRLCAEALKYHTASVCIPPWYVRRAKQAFEQLPVCTVTGFPLGYSVANAKVQEARAAVADGAAEIDMVINICAVKNRDYAAVEEEISAVRRAVQDRVLKVIVETCYLSDEEKKELCGVVTRAKADYIKTSTGFGPAGAVLSDIKLFREHIGPGVRIKAAGGIRSLKDMQAFLQAGADRIGTSSAIRLIQGEKAQAY